MPRNLVTTLALLAILIRPAAGLSEVVIPTPDNEPTEYELLSGDNIDQCIQQLEKQGAGWCEIQMDITSVFPSRQEAGKAWGIIGPKATLIAWNGAAIRYPKMYLHGGGHNDSGLIDVYEADLAKGTIERIYKAPPFDRLLYHASKNQYAWRHGPELPGSTHTYDGFIADPQTGLLILVTGFGYTHGYFKDDSIDPDTDARVTRSAGRGVYAFNPSRDATIKGIPPLSWGKVADRAYSYPSSFAVGNQLYLGSHTEVNKAQWQGNKLALSDTPMFRHPKNYPGTMIFDGDHVFSRNNTHLFRWNPNGRAPEKRVTKSVRHGYSIATLDPGKTISWDGYQKIWTHDWQTNEWQLHHWNEGGPRKGDRSKVYSKWLKVPGHENIFVGWSSQETGPFVYLHQELSKKVVISKRSLQNLVDTAGSQLKVESGIYRKGAHLRKPIDIDLEGVRIMEHAGHGALVVHGGPHIIRNFKQSDSGRAGIWAQDTPRLKLIGFDITNQQFAVITSNNGGEIWLENGVARDIRGGPQYGQQHSFYIGEVDKVTLKNVQSLRHHFGGHLFKSRAPVNVIEDSVFDGGTSNHSRILDFSCGGDIVIRNTRMIQSAKSDNRDLFSIAPEKSCNRGVESTVRIENSYIEARKKKALWANAKGKSVHWEIYDSEIIGVEPGAWPSAKGTKVTWDIKRVTINGKYFEQYQPTGAR